MMPDPLHDPIRKQQQDGPPGHALVHATSSSSAVTRSRPGDSFAYPPKPLLNPSITPAGSSRTNNVGEYPPLQHTSTKTASGEKNKPALHHINPLPSRSLLLSAPGGVHGLPTIEDHELSDKQRKRLSKFHRFPLPADDESHAGLKISSLPESQQQVIRDTLDLYCSRPTTEILKRSWAHDAVFEDPNLKCVGWAEVAAQWFAQAKMFPISRTLSFILLKPTETTVRWEMVQEYTIRGLGVHRTMHSLIEIQLDGEGKIKSLVDKWEGKELTHRATALKRLHARITTALVSVPS